MRRLWLALLLTTAIISGARADFTGKDASLATITMKNATGACTSVVCVPQAAITDNTGNNYVAVPAAGADAASNTANGLQVYTRPSIFNGTTWDRWTGAVSNAGTFAVQLTGATNNINNIAGTVSLPTGASTAANQTTGNTSLASIVTNTTSLGSASSTGTAWTSATGGNTTQVLMAAGQGSPALTVQLNQTTTLTAGAVTFEGSYDNTNWVTIPQAQILNPNTFALLTNPYTLVASTNQPFLVLTQGYQSVRLRLSTVITGTATVTPFVTLLPNNPTVAALLNPLAPGTNIIGKVGIDQTSDGITNGVHQTSVYPSGAVPITASATGTTAATTATLTGAVGKTTYICGFSIRANATAAATGNATVTGTITVSPLNFTQWTAPNANGLGVTEEAFTPCVPASATNTAIAVVSAAPGAGGVVSSTAWGFQQ